MKKAIIALCLMLVPTVVYAEDYEIKNQYGERIGTAIDMGDSDYSIRDNYGQEKGRLVPESTYEPPKYMPEMGNKEGTIMTIHLPSNEDMMK